MVYYLYTEDRYGYQRVLYDIESWCWKDEYSHSEEKCWRTKYVVKPIDENIIKYVYENTKLGNFDYNKFMDAVEAINAIKKQLNPEYGNNKDADLDTASKRNNEYQREIMEILKVAAEDMGLKLKID